MEFTGLDEPAEAITVQNLILRNNDSEILLVHDKGEPGGKRSGYGMPGGSINGFTFESTLNQILKFLPVFRIEFSDFRAVLETETGIDPLIFLTSLREGIEETGFLIRPIRVVLEEATNRNLSSLIANIPHRVVVVQAEIVAGYINKRTVETDDCDWFSLSSLPQDLYRSHLERMKKALVGRNIAIAETEEEFCHDKQ